MHTIVKYTYVITYVATALRSRVHKLVAGYLETIPHIKAYRISKIGIKKPCIIIASNRYTDKLLSKIRRILSYCESKDSYISYKDNWNYYFIPCFCESYEVIVKKDIVNNCLLWE